MTSFDEIIIIDKAINIPVYMQITNSVIHNIRRGILRSGLKLPGARELAKILKIHRKTLQTAYDELMAQGWVEIIPRKGTFIVRDLPEIKPSKIPFSQRLSGYPERTAFSIDTNKIPDFPASNMQYSKELILDDGLPDIRLAPTELLMKEYRGLSKLTAFKKYYRYGGPKGAAYLLETLSVYLNETRGLAISENNILITKGAQMGIYLAAKLLLKPGDNVIVGEPGYFAAVITFRQADAAINRVPIDEHGIDVDQIEKLCNKKKIKLLYVIPHHHYPTTVTLIPERRMRLLELAAHYKFAIIEDDYDYDFHYNSSPVLPIASLDQHGNTIYIGTLTKTFVPAIRIGFVIAPENYINAVSNLRRAIDWQGDSMMEVAMAQLYKNGTIERHIKKAVKLYRERRDYFCTQLKNKIGEHIFFNIPDGGMAVWAKFKGIDLKLVAGRAAGKGLIMNNGTLYNSINKDYNATRLGFASLNLNEQDKAIEILKDSLL
jgi:GntR family transcriptional regulator/MocR family aminotransferase